MGAPTCLTDPTGFVVIDASAVINLNATGCAADILQALPHRVLVVDIVLTELEAGRIRGRRDVDLLSELTNAKLIEIVTLDSSAEECFENLVVGNAASTLDDGEAATLAYAVAHDVTAIIDERKAIRISGERFPALRLDCTVGLFAHPSVVRILGRQRLSQALTNALQLARMRVLPHQVDWVIEIIGPERALLCASLPRSARLPAPSSVARSKH